MIWAQLLAYVTGTVNRELLVRNEYLATENRILKAQIKGRLLLSKEEKAKLAEIAHRLGRKALEGVASTAQPDAILGWYRKLIANKFDGSRFRRRVGRPKVAEEIERLVVRMAKKNPSWGLRSDRRCVGESMETRRVSLAGFTPYPDQEWMEQQARNMTMEQWGCLRGGRYLLHERDRKFCQSFRELIESGSVKPIRLPARSPNLNSYAERWVRSCFLRGEGERRKRVQYTVGNDWVVC